VWKNDNESGASRILLLDRHRLLSCYLQSHTEASRFNRRRMQSLPPKPFLPAVRPTNLTTQVCSKACVGNVCHASSGRFSLSSRLECSSPCAPLTTYNGAGCCESAPFAIPNTVHHDTRDSRRRLDCRRHSCGHDGRAVPIRSPPGIRFRRPCPYPSIHIHPNDSIPHRIPS
jgi:hypothetical protein